MQDEEEFRLVCEQAREARLRAARTRNQSLAFLYCLRRSLDHRRALLDAATRAREEIRRLYRTLPRLVLPERNISLTDPECSTLAAEESRRSASPAAGASRQSADETASQPPEDEHRADQA